MESPGQEDVPAQLPRMSSQAAERWLEQQLELWQTMGMPVV